MSGESLPWTSAQQAWLQAMGYTVFQDGALEIAASGGVDPALTAGPAAVADPSAVHLSAVLVPGLDPRHDVRHASARRAPAPESASEPSAPPPRRAPAAETPGRNAPLPAPRTGTARQPAVRLPDRLQIALLRASGRNPSDPATQALMETWPLDVLRGNPAAKRALWPQLRALRRKGTS